MAETDHQTTAADTETEIQRLRFRIEGLRAAIRAELDAEDFGDADLILVSAKALRQAMGELKDLEASD